MDDKLNEDVNQLLTVSAVCHAYPTVLLLVDRMGAHLITLDGKIFDIKAKAQLTGINIHGLYVVKGDAKTGLVAIMVSGFAAIRSLATELGDKNLKNSAKYKAYQIERLHKNDLITLSTNFLAVATNNAAQLIAHGFEAADITEWQTLHTAFVGAAEAPAVKREVHKTDLSELKSMVSEALFWVRDTMDDTAFAFKRKAPSFFKLYTFAREKHHQGHRKRKSGGETITNPGEYILDILRGNKIMMAGFPILPDKTYLFENLKQANLRFWTQETSVAPAEIPEDAAILEIAEDLESKGTLLGAPGKPYLFFGNQALTEDGEVAISIED